jgi:pyridoxine kinase
MMHKQVLSIQDLSCVGKCSLTVALPVLSAMGCQCSVLPTAVFSTHTAFPSPHKHSLTQEILPICRHWQSIGAKFDAITVGYLADGSQVEAVEEVLDRFPAFSVIDPVMGDHGKLYSGLCESHVDAVRSLCRRGQVILPNVTEAALLTGLPYTPCGDETYFRSLLDKLMELGAPNIVITGASLEEGKTGIIGYCPEEGYFSFQRPLLPRSHHGTGDLFAAAFTGGVLAGKTVPQASLLAARFVEQVILATPDSTAFGVYFEGVLPWLWREL